jgi:hypothetical protein
VAEARAPLLAHLPARGDPLAVELPHPHGRLAQGSAVGGVDRLGRGIPLLARDLEGLDPGAVVLLDAGEELLVAALADAIDDAADVPLDLVGPALPSIHQAIEGRLEARGAGLQNGHDALCRGAARHAQPSRRITAPRLPSFSSIRS